MRLRQFTISIVAALLPLVASADDDGQALSLWQVGGESNTIYLLGSIHMLRAQDHPLPPAIYAAYDDAEKLIMELDMDDLNPVDSQALSNELGLIQDGRTLSDLMGEALYAEAEQLAVTAQIPLALLANAEPWFAAMNVEIMLLMRMGFNPSLGVESALLERAQADGKEILGFETIRQQLEFLDGLSQEAQREMLIQALADGADMREMMDGMIEAWRTGDVAYLEKNLLADMQDYPELNQTIVVDRNVNWTNEIEDMLDDDIDYLIVVGTLHLVGEDGVPQLLEARGHEVTQLRQSVN
jgi:uncharacterized protein YbaP (TraB family)